MDGVDGQGYNRIDFSKVIEQEDLCRECKEKGNFIRCLSGGYLWDVEVTRNGRFRVAPRMCGFRRTAIEDRERAKQKPKEPTIQAKKWWGKTMSRDTVAKKIVALDGYENMTQREIASAIGVCQSTVHKTIKQKNIPHGKHSHERAIYARVVDDLVERGYTDKEIAQLTNTSLGRVRYTRLHILGHPQVLLFPE